MYGYEGDLVISSSDLKQRIDDLTKELGSDKESYSYKANEFLSNINEFKTLFDTVKKGQKSAGFVQLNKNSTQSVTQTIEQQLFNSLEENTGLTTDQQKKIVEKINNISNMRVNLYKTLNEINNFFQNNLANSKGLLTEQTAAIDIVEKELEIEDNCVFFIDEIHIWLDSRISGSKRNRILSYFLLQSGKLGKNTDYGLIML